MWSDFYAAAAALCVILLVPGFLALRAVGLSRASAACCAPVASVALVSGTGQVYALAGVASSPVSVLAPLVVVLALACALARRRLSEVRCARPGAWVPLVFVALGVAVAYNLFVSRLPGGPDALFQAYDLTQHVNTIRAMADSGRFSSIGVTPYLTAADQAIAPVDYATFYPSAWHALCALAVQLTGASVPVVINASMFVFTGVAFPLSMAAFLGEVFGGGRRLVLLGAVAAVSFVAFPWVLLAFGPIWPNVAGFSVMPGAMTLFVLMISPDEPRAARARVAAALLVTVAGLALLHPNTIFTCAVILSPYCLSRLWRARALEGWSRLRWALACAALAAAFAAAWLVCYRLPFLQDTVTHHWDSFARPWQEVVNILTQTYTLGFFSEIAAQLLLGALVVAGAVRALHEDGRRWMAVSYALACLICFVGATRDDELQHLLAGFWYTDPMRLAAMASIAAMPLAALGLDWAYEVALGAVRSYNDRRERATHPVRVAAAVVGAFLLVNFMPEFNLPGLNHPYTEKEQAYNRSVRDPRDYAKSVHTTFGDLRDVMVEVYDYGTPLDSGERIFLDDVRQIVGDELVLNDPMDGSFLAYGVCGLRVYNRNFVGYGGSAETEESRVVRTSLSSIATDGSVREAVRSLGARYVIVMRQTDSEYSLINQRQDYKPELFSGISSITPDTEGFTLVYRYGSMYLYEIDAD